MCDKVRKGILRQVGLVGRKDEGNCMRVCRSIRAEGATGRWRHMESSKQYVMDNMDHISNMDLRIHKIAMHGGLGNHATRASTERGT